MSELGRAFIRVLASVDRTQVRREVDRAMDDAGKRGGATFAKSFSSETTRGLTRLHNVIGGRGTGGTGGLIGDTNRLVSSLGGLAGTGTTLINPITVAAAGLAAVMSGPVIAALLPITAGFAGLAAVAVPALTKVWNAVSKGGAALKALSPAERALAGPMRALKGQWAQLSAAVRPEIMRAFGIALGIVRRLMPALRPLMVAAGKAAIYFLGQLSDWLKSPSGKKFLHWLEVQGPRDIRIFGRVMWIMAQGAGRTFTFLLNAGNTWWKNFKYTLGLVRAAALNLRNWLWTDFGARIVRLFARTLPDAFSATERFIRIWTLRIEILMAGWARNILGWAQRAFGWLPDWLPGVSGIKRGLAAAHRAIGSFVTGAQNELNRLTHKPHAIQFKVDLPAGVALRHHQRQFAKGTTGAPPGWAWVGEKGPELAYFRGGETVIPNHALGGIRGFAAGTGNVYPQVTLPSRRDVHTLFAEAAAAIVGYVRKHAYAPFGFSFPVPIPHFGGGVRRWAGLVHLALAMERLPQWLTGRVLYQMQTESGGDPNAINLWDSNAQRGDPSRGLLQVIMSTFRAYHWPGTSWNIFSPLANIAAAINYARHRYGPTLMTDGMGMGSGHGYDRGGWLEPGWTMAYNGTGRPEAVTSEDGLARLERLLKQLIAVERTAPRRTAAGVAEALSGVGRGARHSALWSTRTGGALPYG